MSAGKYAAVYTPGKRTQYKISASEMVTPASDREIAQRMLEQVRVKALLDSAHATDLLEVLGLTNA